jgi:putative OPT family oligopeptide transporter
MMAVGYIIGFNTAAWLFAGTVLAFWVLTPAVAMLTVESAALDVATFEAVRGDFVKPIAIGAMLVGGIWTLISMRGAIATSLKRARGARGVELEKMPRTERDLPLKLAFIVISTLCIPTFAIYWYLSKSAGFGIMALVLALIFGFIFSSVSAYIVGLVGSSNNPASGMTLATLFVSCAVLAGLGVTGDTGMILAIGIIAIACCALAIGGDQMQDLKAGYMLGATPRNQQIMQLIGVVAMALVAVPLLNMLASAYGIGPGPDGTGGLEAPQAFMMRSTASAFFETGTPWLLYAIGGALAFMLILFGLPVLPIAIGLYLSFWMIAGIFVGGIVRWITDRMMMRRSDEERDAATNNGVIASSGLVAGSALMGIVIAFVIVLSRKNLNEWAGTAVGAATWPIYVIMALVALFIIYIATHEFIGKGKKA